MKHRSLVLLAALPALLAFPGCERQNGGENRREAARAAGGDHRQAEDRIRARLDELDREIRQLREDARRETGPAREKLNRRIDELTGQRGTLDEQFDKLRASGRDAWSDLKQALDRSIDQLEDAYHKTEDDLKRSK